MNQNAPLCASYRDDFMKCYNENNTDFETVINVDGVGFCTFSTNRKFYITEIDPGSDGVVSDNIGAFS